MELRVRRNGCEKIIQTTINLKNCFGAANKEREITNLPVIYNNGSDELVATVEKVWHPETGDDVYIMNIAPIPTAAYEKVWNEIESLRMTIKKIEGSDAYLFILSEN